MNTISMIKAIRRIISMIILTFIAYMLYRIVQQNQNHLAIDQNKPLIVQQLRAVQKLETTEMKVTKILKGKQELTDQLPGISRDDKVSDFLFGESIAMEIYGTVTAGFDLSAITTGAITLVKTGVVTIHLPQPIITHASLDPETQVFQRDLGILNKGNKNTETKIRNQALHIIREASIQQGILSQAIINAKSALQKVIGPETIIQNITISKKQK